MEARFARTDDAPEMVRLGAVMFTSMGVDASDHEWRDRGVAEVTRRLGDDLAGFVVDHPDEPGRLVASAAGTIAQRLPSPFVPSGRAGYVQWVCTDDVFRGRGLARAVMEALLDWFAAHDVGTVELHATPMAESLYRSMGFDDAGPRALRHRRPR